MTLTVEQEILNAASDDWESFEQIYRSVCLEFSAENYIPGDPSAYYWREGKQGISLAQLADAVIHLVSAAMLQARQEDGTFVTVISGDWLWRCWYKTTQIGCKRLLDSLHNGASAPP